jgi:Putative transposase
VIYDLLFKASAEITLEIAATPRHLGARRIFMSMLHTWGSALTHHRHVLVVPGAGLSRRMDRSGSRADRVIFLPVEVCFWRC